MLVVGCCMITEACLRGWGPCLAAGGAAPEGKSAHQWLQTLRTRPSCWGAGNVVLVAPGRQLAILETGQVLAAPAAISLGTNLGDTPLAACVLGREHSAAPLGREPPDCPPCWTAGESVSPLVAKGRRGQG